MDQRLMHGIPVTHRPWPPPSPPPLAAYCFLVFILLYVPCVAAVSTMYREMGSLKWTLFSIGWQLLCAYGVTFLIYQLGSLFL